LRTAKISTKVAGVTFY